MSEKVELYKPFHQHLEDLINRSDLKQFEIAEELGYEYPNIITMFKQGKTKVPIEKIPLLAKILKIDPNALLMKYLREYDPVLLKVIEKHFGAIVTQNEINIINEVRRLSRGTDPGLTSIESKIAIEHFVQKICSDFS
jgi:hypothetical protein